MVPRLSDGAVTEVSRAVSARARPDRCYLVLAVVLGAVDFPAHDVLLMVDLPPVLRSQSAVLAVVPDLFIEPRFLMLEPRSLLRRERAVLDALPDPVLLIFLPLAYLRKGRGPRQHRAHHDTQNHSFHGCFLLYSQTKIAR